MVAMHDSNGGLQRPNAGRITALSGAMTVNLLVLGALLIPISIPSAPPRVERPTTVVEVEISRRAIPLPIPKIPDPPVIPHRHEVTPVPVPIEQPQTPIFTTAANSIPVDLETPVTPPVDTSGPTGPIESSGLSYIHAPPPRFPIIALRRHWEGVVLLRVLVGEDGRALRVEVQKTSGHREFDDAAREKVQQEWRFTPAVQDGRTVQAWGTVPIKFELLQG